MKKIYHTLIYSILLLSFTSLLGCKKDVLNKLAVSPANIEFEKEGSFTGMSIQTDADSWSISNPASEWLVLSRTSGTEKTALVTLSVNTKTAVQRLDTLTITAGNAKPFNVIVSQPSSDYIYALSCNYDSLDFKRAGNSAAISITTDAPHWNISHNGDWLQFSQETGNSGNTTITVTALENMDIDSRSAMITLSAEYAQTVQISVTQKGEYYPGYNTSPIEPDETGMSSNATELAAKINLGWNIGNSLEAIGGETAWGNPPVTKALIDLVRQSGFNAIRIPCSFNQYMANSSTAQLKTEWLDRVKTVIQYCVDDDMYVLLNIHWDGGWLENNCTEAKQEENNAKQKAFWEQIATHLRDFDEHLLFAGANGPNVENATQMAVLQSYHQTFIDAVRSTGGRNAYRVLVVQGPSTDIEKTHELMSSLPNDDIPNRMMVEVHYYTPWNFCGMTEDADWGIMFYYWGEGYHSATDPTRNATWGEEETVDANFALMKSQFVDDDILPFYWDNGGTGNNACGIFNRNSKTVFDQQALDALIQGGGKERMKER